MSLPQDIKDAMVKNILEEHPEVERLQRMIPAALADKAVRAGEIDLILKSRLDRETYQLVIEIAELAMDIAMAHS